MFEFIQANILLVVLTLTSGGMLLFPMLRPGGKEVSPTDATLMINRENAVFIDVRSAAEFASGHVPDSINIPREKIVERIAEIEKYKDRPLILNCASGARSGSACGELRKRGFDKVFNLAGGVGAWAQAGLPIKKGAK
ncbi:MAG TPA: rhodanese-like domain-containing protein [Rhodocyclaceae bacterium]|nr:rhodanese-like domain-containing protein [Rhodocyclaceae bacterium]